MYNQFMMRGHFIDAAMGAAREAGYAILKSQRRGFTVERKGEHDFLTSADLESERIIRSRIKSKYPSYTILSEETVDSNMKSFCYWVVDPLDGTENFRRGLPLFSISIALVQDDSPIIGVVYAPALKLSFVGVANEGFAMLNGKAIKVSPVRTLADSKLGMDWARQKTSRAILARNISNLALDVESIGCFGCASLAICFVAAGWLDGYFQQLLYPWDIAAGAVIVRAAGGLVTDKLGQQWMPGTGDCVVSNGKIHKELLERLNDD